MHCGNPHFVGQILNWFLPFDVWWRFAPDLDVEESLSALVRLLVLQVAHALGHLQLLQGWNYYFSIRAHSIRESAQTLEMIDLIRSNNKISHRMAIALKQTVAVVAQWVKRSWPKILCFLICPVKEKIMTTFRCSNFTPRLEQIIKPNL